MRTHLPTSQPFSFDQTVAFIRRFPPCRGDYLVADDALTAAVTVDDRAVPMTIRRRGAGLEVESPEPAAVAHAAHWIGAADDLAAFYARADGDRALAPVIEHLWGLHHVRFLTLEEISVYCVMMQRTPIRLAARIKRAFLDRFGTPVEVGGATLRAMPSFARLCELDAGEIGEAIRNRRKGEQIATVVRGVAALGEAMLRTAPYAVARDALLAIPGVGPFSAGAILLRGLGRMDEVPSVGMFETDARAIYGAAFDEAAIARRYGDQIGYWSFYVKTGGHSGSSVRTSRA